MMSNHGWPYPAAAKHGGTDGIGAAAVSYYHELCPDCWQPVLDCRCSPGEGSAGRPAHSVAHDGYDSGVGRDGDLDDANGNGPVGGPHNGTGVGRDDADAYVCDPGVDFDDADAGGFGRDVGRGYVADHAVTVALTALMALSLAFALAMALTLAMSLTLTMTMTLFSKCKGRQIMEMERISLTLKLQMESYIAHPYWPEKDEIINIGKKSGMNVGRMGEAKREKSLLTYLDKIGMSKAAYEALVAAAERQWYRVDDGDPTTSIVIPRHHMSGCLVQTIKTSTSSVRGPFKEDNLRHRLRMNPLLTNKAESDEVFDRYVVLDKSNQRSRQKNEVIKDFEAEGTIEVTTDVKLKDLKTLIAYAVLETGLGASRKMGFGRGQLVSLEAA